MSRFALLFAAAATLLIATPALADGPDIQWLIDAEVDRHNSRITELAEMSEAFLAEENWRMFEYVTPKWNNEISTHEIAMEYLLNCQEGGYTPVLYGDIMRGLGR